MPKIVYEPPKLILIAGPIAVGKSYLAEHLMQHVAGALLNRGYSILDVFDEFDGPVERDGSNQEYRRRATKSFEMVYRHAEGTLATANTVCLDTPFNNIRWGERDERLDGIVARFHPDFRLFICTAPDEVIRQRMSTRENGHPRRSDISKLANWEEYAARMHRIGDVQYAYTSIDTTRPTEENVKEMLEELSRTV